MDRFVGPVLVLNNLLIKSRLTIAVQRGAVAVGEEDEALVHTVPTLPCTVGSWLLAMKQEAKS